MALFHAIYNILWGDLITIPLPGGSTLGLSLLVLILVPAGIYFTVRMRFLPFRLFPFGRRAGCGRRTGRCTARSAYPVR